MTMMHDQDSDAQSARVQKRKGEMKPELGKLMKKNKHCRASKAKWTPEEDETLTRAVMMAGEGNWKKIAQSLDDRSHLQCLHRWQKVLNPALVKGPWKEEEDAKLTELVEKYGPKDWSTIASHIPGRIGKQCRERWFNHLSPDVRKTNWTPEEDRIIIDAHSKIGNKWTNISKLLEGRPANAIKNHWNSTLLKRIQDSAGEPTPRRDRSRNKKPPPMRATEFEFRTQTQPQQFEDCSDSSSSPQQYSQQISPASSPEMYQEVPSVNAVRFQHPEVAQHVFFNPFTDHGSVPTTVSTCTSVWDSWPAPNVINLASTQSTPTVPIHPTATSNSANFGHCVPNHNAIAFTNGSYTHNSLNNALNNAMNTYEPAEYSLGLAHATPEEFMELYNNNANNSSQSNSTLPVELQYCFEHQGGLDGAYTSIDSSGMNVPVNMNMSNMNMSNLGLLNMEIPGFCPLDI